MTDILTADDIAMVREARRTAWQQDRMLVGEDTGIWMRPLFSDEDDIGGTVTRTLQIVKTLPVYYEHVPDVLVAQSNGVFQPDYLQVRIFDTGAACHFKDLWYLDNRLYSIVRQHYHEVYDQMDLMVAPHSELLDSVSVLGASAEQLQSASIRVRSGSLWMLDTEDGLYHRITLTGGVLASSEETL